MPDAARAAMMRLIYLRLADPSFRRYLTATAPDGTRPLIAALRDDAMSDLLEKVHCAGGSANVVVPALNGFLVLEMQVEKPTPGAAMDPDVQELASDCTVGLFVARLRVDDGATPYRLTVLGGGRQHRDAQPPRSGQARVVALGS